MDFKKTDADGQVVSWWNVSPTDDYTQNCIAGREYAQQFIQAVRGNEAHVALPHIVSEFPGTMTGIEIGFLQEVSESLSMLT